MSRIQNKTLGFYLPSFFRLNLSIEGSLLELNTVSDSDFSIFVHEYIHFLQDITTFYGQYNAYVTTEYLNFCNDFLLKENITTFNVPIAPLDDNSDNVLLNKTLSKITYGDSTECNVKQIISYKIENLDINIPNSQINKIPIVDIEFIDDKKNTNYYSFGAACIMESIAYLIEQLSFENYHKSPDFPYCSAELLAKHVLPEFAKNKRNILALCESSLKLSNPAQYFIETLNYWRDENISPSSPNQVYKHFNDDNLISKRKGNIKWDAHIKDFSDLLKKQINSYFNGQYFSPIREWLENLIDSAIEIRIKRPDLFLQLATKDLRKSELFHELIEKLGTPLLTNNDKEFGFYSFHEKKSDINLGHFWAIHQIQNIFLGYLGKCELLPFCQHKLSQVVTDFRCFKEPWKRSRDSEPCIVGLTWRRWGLKDFEPKVNC